MQHLLISRADKDAMLTVDPEVIELMRVPVITISVSYEHGIHEITIPQSNLTGMLKELGVI